MILTDKTATVTLAEFEELLEYSTSIPTGLPVGKRWRRGPHERDVSPFDERWLMGEVEPDPKGQHGYVLIRWRRLVVETPRETQVREALEAAAASDVARAAVADAFARNVAAGRLMFDSLRELESGADRLRRALRRFPV